jgi:hypothetical protein
MPEETFNVTLKPAKMCTMQLPQGMIIEIFRMFMNGSKRYGR